ncbi:MAG: sugar kinase, partial [Acidobacteria bacterium]|nr:sugar kinase [Acidobacteriota bacterium]
MTLWQKVQDGFAAKNIVVLGDAVADQFLEGTIARVSREAPVFILRHDETATLPGAAANAAANITALGGHTTLVGLCGNDANGERLRACLEQRNVDIGGLIAAGGICTTTKVRVLAGHQYGARQQVIRIDYEDTPELSAAVRDELVSAFRTAASKADAIVVSDYGYGAVFPGIFDEAKRVASDRMIPLVVDSRHRLTEFAGATSATPNREEVEQILGEDFTADACAKLRKRLGLEALLVTNGNQGMTLFDADQPFAIKAIGSTEPVDVTGAGDTVIATYSLGLASGLTFREAAEVANHAGGLVVMKKRTATVALDELLDSLKTDDRA